MNKLTLNKLKPEDLETVNDAVSLYSQYLDFFTQSEPTQTVFVYKSIAVELEYMIAGRFKVRRVPAKSLLNLEVHQGFVLQNALQHFIGITDNQLRSAKAYKLLERVNQMLPVVAQTQE